MYYQVEEQDGYYRIGSPENVFCYLLVGSKQMCIRDRACTGCIGIGYFDLRDV